MPGICSAALAHGLGKETGVAVTVGARTETATRPDIIAELDAEWSTLLSSPRCLICPRAFSLQLIACGSRHDGHYICAQCLDDGIAMQKGEAP